MTTPYTVDMLADRWGCSSQHVRNMISKGLLPAFRFGKLIRIPAQQVEEFERCSSVTVANGACSTDPAASESGYRPASTIPQKIVRLPNGRRCRLPQS
jgi:excisionase family DNA binding protein